MAYQVKLEKFEGPLATLLEMIEKRKLSINEISLAEVTDQYLNYLKALESFPLDEASGFVAIAATLILLKSASLLPAFTLTEEEKGDIKNLERRLQFYGLIRNYIPILGKFFGKKILFSREAFLGCSFEFLEPRGLTKKKLRLTLKQIISNLPQRKILPEAMVKKAVSLEKKIEEIVGRIHQQIEMSFADFSGLDQSASQRLVGLGPKKIEIIVSFLAVLELIKRGFIIVEQSAVFDTIKIKKSV